MIENQDNEVSVENLLKPSSFLELENETANNSELDVIKFASVEKT